ncbi:hypothetical protein NMG60_11020722 [Bertholletia excelsa]
MASPFRSHIFGGDRKQHNGVHFVDPQGPVLSVAPLNSVPYMGPPSPPILSGDIPSSPTEMETASTARNEPAMVFLHSCPSEEEWNNIIAGTKGGVGLTGAATMGKVGPTVGSVDIGECEDAYIFRVSLPGVSNDENEFSCDIDPSGKIVIEGVTSTGERIIHRQSLIFEMLTQNLCPPGHFSISFQLPGPVDRQQFTSSFGVDGILEGLVKKKVKDKSMPY